MKRFLLTFFLTSGIWSVALADSTVFTGAQIEDAYIYSSNNVNFGGTTHLRASATRSFLLRVTGSCWDYLGTNPILDSGAIDLYCYLRESGTGVSDAFPLYGVLKTACWLEGSGTGAASDTDGVTHTDWNATGSEWGTAGCDNAHDDSLFNCGDGSGYDRWTTAYDTLITGTATTPGWLRTMLPLAYMEVCKDSSLGPTFMVHGATNTQSWFYSSENSNYQPRVVLYWHEGEAPEQPTGGRVMIH